MAATVALAVALSRTPPPAPSTSVAVPSHGAGHAVLSASVEPFTLGRLLTEWRLDAVVLAVALLGLVAYFSGVRRLVVEGGRWPVARSLAALGAALVLVLALCGGMAEDAVALLSVQVAQLLTLLLVVPGLVALSAPLSLLRRRARPLPRVLTVLADPVNGVALVIVLLVAVYATPLLSASLQHVSVHRLVDAVVLAVGMVLMGSLAGVDPVPGPHRSGRDRMVLALVLAVVLIAFGVLLTVRRDLVAGAWFTGLHWTWADPVADQRRAAGVAWAFAQVVVPLLLVVVCTQSTRAVTSVSRRSR